MWRSKLGTDFPRELIERDEKKHMAALDRLRRLPANRECADCGADGTVWASVNIGVFLCLRCGALHRGLGTHVSVPKGCTGTYLWGPDEIASMTKLGNERARSVWGVGPRPARDAPDAEWQLFVTDKYVLRRFAPAPGANGPPATTSAPRCSTTRQSVAPAPVTVPTGPAEVPDFLTFAEDDAPAADEVPELLSFTDDASRGHSMSCAPHACAPRPDFFSEFGL